MKILNFLKVPSYKVQILTGKVLFTFHLLQGEFGTYFIQLYINQAS